MLSAGTAGFKDACTGLKVEEDSIKSDSVAEREREKGKKCFFETEMFTKVSKSFKAENVMGDQVRGPL